MPPEPARLLSLSCPTPQLTVSQFLRSAEGRERFFWQDGESGVVWASAGIAAELFAWGDNPFSQIENQARQLFTQAILRHEHPLAQPRLFGGFAFRHDFTPDNTWSAFHPAQFILPHFQLVQQGQQSWLTINALLPPEEELENSLSDLQEALNLAQEQWLMSPARVNTPAKLCRMDYPMSQEVWAQMLQQAIQQIQAGVFQKVVLSRVCELWFDQPPDLIAALDYLRQHYAGCYLFLFEPRPHHAFYGATPELLVQVMGDRLQTMGLAGSIRRGKTAVEDEQLAEVLLHSPKDGYEHALVVDSIRRRLQKWTVTLDVPAQPTILRLPNIQHLYTPIHAQLAQQPGVLPLVAELHPTPALGGTPRHKAMSFIRQTEPVPRGWYAAPIGWIDCQLNGTFAVAIRSTVTQQERVWLYAGAGIVADSDPQKEWNETALKFKPILQSLGQP